LRFRAPPLQLEPAFVDCPIQTAVEQQQHATAAASSINFMDMDISTSEHAATMSLSLQLKRHCVFFLCLVLSDELHGRLILVLLRNLILGIGPTWTQSKTKRSFTRSVFSRRCSALTDHLLWCMESSVCDRGFVGGVNVACRY
jgi:hypothetical protein